MLTSRERLRRCYFHEELDRPGVYSRTGFPEDDASYDRLKAYLLAHADLKTVWNGRAFEAPLPAEVFLEPASEDYDRQVTIVHAPAGDLRATFLLSRRGLPGMQESYFITSPEDAAIFLSLPLPAIDGDTSSFADADRRIGTRGIVDVGLGLNPAGYVAELCGSETFALMSVTDRDVLHALCARQQQILLATARFLMERQVGPYFSLLGQEFLTPPLHGPRDFDDFNVRYDWPILDLVHGAGGRMHVHSHGRIARVFAGFLALGADVLHPLEAPPMGDITAREAKALARGRICLEGNIQIADMYECPPEEIRRQTAELIEAAFDDGRGLIVSPSASPYMRGAGETCFPQYRAMIDTVLDWR